MVEKWWTKTYFHCRMLKNLIPISSKCNALMQLEFETMICKLFPSLWLIRCSQRLLCTHRMHHLATSAFEHESIKVITRHCMYSFCACTIIQRLPEMKENWLCTGELGQYHETDHSEQQSLCKNLVGVKETMAPWAHSPSFTVCTFCTTELCIPHYTGVVLFCW